MSASVAEIFRSVGRSDCNERAFMLFAVGIASAIGRDAAGFVLLVDVADVPAALHHLQQYEVELRVRRPPPPPPPRLYPHAWIGSALYVLVLLTVTYAISNGLWRLDAFDVGELDAARVQRGQWWRIWTALTLHLDGPHLLANSVAGVWFGYLAGRLLGVGHGWLLVVIGAGFANLIEAELGPALHRSVGASTAVFAALGVLSAFSWRARYAWPQRWALRWGPLIAGLVLLGWTGTGGQDLNGEGSGTGEAVDVVAHALGFATGMLLGTLAALQSVRPVLDRIPQWAAGIVAVAVIAAAWACGLAS